MSRALQTCSRTKAANASVLCTVGMLVACCVGLVKCYCLLYTGYMPEESVVAFGTRDRLMKTYLTSLVKLSRLIFLISDFLINCEFSGRSCHAVAMCMQFGRTEAIQNTLNPDFVRKFVMDYFFEESQKLKFEV